MLTHPAGRPGGRVEAVCPGIRAKRGMEFLKQDGSTFRGYKMLAALSEDESRTWPVRKLITAGSGDLDDGAWTGKFTAPLDNAEPAR